MNELSRLQAKKRKLVIGLISGTSVDGIDAVLIRLSGSGIRTKFKQLAFSTHPYPHGVRRLILKNSVTSSSSVEEICRLNFFLGELFAEAAAKVAKVAGYRLSDVDLIGSHGQTIHHLPQPEKLGGRVIRGTLQIGDPSVIAKQTGIPTVGDFRVADVALGGEGAPLVPYLDFLLFHSPKKSRGLLNIGGIANITILPKKCTHDEVKAFDTGPGNMVIDALMKKFYGKRYDEGGKVALQGKVSRSLIRKLGEHPFLKRKPPKSTGREEFGDQFLAHLLELGSSMGKANFLATATDFTVYCVYENYRRFIAKETTLNELIVSGGGVHNAALMGALRRYFGLVPVKKIDEYGVSGDAKEALCFALLANETISGNPGNIPAVTGARKATVLGKICL